MKKNQILFFTFVLLGLAFASQRIFKESSNVIPNGWEMSNKRAIEDGSREIVLTFAMKQRNEEKLEKLFWDISNPSSRNYAKYLTMEQVNELTAPKSESIEKFLEFLFENGISKEKITIHPSKGFVSVKIELRVAENLLETSFASFVHSKTGRKSIKALNNYSLPKSVAHLVDFVSGFRLPNYNHRKSIESMEYTHVHPSLYRDLETNQPSSGPTLIYVNALDEFATIQFVPRCANNQTSTSTDICSDTSSTSVSFFNIQARQNGDQNIVNYSFLVNETKCGECNNGSACSQYNSKFKLSSKTIYCSASLKNLKNYLNTTIYLTTFFKDGSSSETTAATDLAFFASKFTTPDDLFDIYNVPANLRVTNPGATQSVAEFLGQYYATSDLTKFFSLFGLPDNSKLVKVIGPNDEKQPGGEATLDIEYIMGVAVNSPTTFWSLGQLHEGQEPFLQWIIDVLNNPKAPLVHSISYGDDENSLTGEYVNRINVEFKKAGVRGLSLFFSSGDNGVFGGANFKCDSFTPSFPASSPFATSVGATLFSTKTKPVCFERFAGQDFPCHEVGETTSSTSLGSRISSGGGFSTFFAAPPYQRESIKSYLKYVSNIPQPQYFNNTGRAYPDISAIGHNFVVLLAGKIAPIDGTSASAPVIAGLVTLLNDARLNNGKAPLGFINPWLYSLTSNHFNDIVTGDNKCSEIPWICCNYGFPATPGYDAVTGLGSPNFEALLESALLRG